jgi:hypothetical protein
MLSKDIERIEREATMRQDADWQRQLKEAAKAPAPTTMHEFAVAEASQSHGRFTQVQASNVIGSAPIPQYPKASAPFQNDPVGDEPPLGYRIDDLNPFSDPEPDPLAQATDDPAPAPSSGSGPAPYGGSVSERAGSSPSSETESEVGRPGSTGASKQTSSTKLK